MTKKAIAALLAAAALAGPVEAQQHARPRNAPQSAQARHPRPDGRFVPQQLRHGIPYGNRNVPYLFVRFNYGGTYYNGYSYYGTFFPDGCYPPGLVRLLAEQRDSQMRFGRQEDAALYDWVRSGAQSTPQEPESHPTIINNYTTIINEAPEPREESKAHSHKFNYKNCIARNQYAVESIRFLESLFDAIGETEIRAYREGADPKDYVEVRDGDNKTLYTFSFKNLGTYAPMDTFSSSLYDVARNMHGVNPPEVMSISFDPKGKYDAQNCPAEFLK